MVRAPALHAGGHWFESSTAHFFCGPSRSRSSSPRDAPNDMLGSAEIVLRALGLSVANVMWKSPPIVVRSTGGRDFLSFADRGR